jgi:ATP-dependent Clp protease ATP-binding subunit ClpC
VYGSEEMLLFLEMGQYQTKESMNNFVGAPAGFVGYGEGKLTNGLRDKPECVVLFDEIEKADVQVFNALLRFADEGRISDPAGPERDGRRCIIVMTTNAGQYWLQEEYLGVKEIVGSEAVTARLSEIRQSTSFCADFMAAARKQLSEKGFQPEFIGRIDELITFLPMDFETCEQILGDVLEREALRLHEAKGIALIAEDQQARKILAKKALERSLREGARAVPRVVNELIVNRVIDLASGAEERGESLTSLYVVHRGIDVGVEP